MELQELKPGKQDVDVSGARIEEAPSRREKNKKKRSKGRIWLLALVLALCVAGLALALNWTSIQVGRDPVGAVKRGMDRVADLPEPLSLGFLGTVELSGETLDCSGVMDLETGAEGMRLALKDCTVGAEDASSTFSLYVSPTQAAASAPTLTGGDTGWYGLSLETPLAQQANDAGVGERYNALFDETQRAEAQAAADGLRASLQAVTELGLGDAGHDGLTAFLQASAEETEKTSEGYLLRFTQSDADRTRQLAQALGLSEDLFRGPATVEFTLTSGGALRGVNAVSENLSFTLDLGSDPVSELVPRLEATWDGGALTLALSVDAGLAVTAPEYADVFTLLAEMGENT